MVENNIEDFLKLKFKENEIMLLNKFGFVVQLESNIHYDVADKIVEDLTAELQSLSADDISTVEDIITVITTNKNW